jgi:hypothetical protein
LPHADHGAMFGQAVFHGGDDLFGKRDLRNLSALFLGCPAYLIARKWWRSIFCAQCGRRFERFRSTANADRRHEAPSPIT